MIIPAALQSGDTIALISPASQVKHHYIDAATRRLEEWGFRVLKGEHVYDSYGNFAGTAEQRLSDLRKALCNPDVKAILCTRGGYGAVHLLEGITPEEIRRNAKWLIGFSDISALHAAWVRAGVASLHASMAKHLTEEGDDHVVTRYFRDILAGQRPCYHVASHPFNRHGSVSARIVGGNMAVFAAARSSPMVQERILEVYNNDGPGFNRNMAEFSGYEAVKDKMQTTLPHFSVVGLLLEHTKVDKIVKSTADGLWQHDPFSWEIKGTHFVTEKKLSNDCLAVEKALKSWIKGQNFDERREFVGAVYSVLSANSSQTLSDIANNKFDFILSLTKVDPKIRDVIVESGKLLIKEGWNTAQGQKKLRKKDSGEKA